MTRTRLARTLGAGWLVAVAMAGCSHQPELEIPTGLRPRAEAIDPETATDLFAQISRERADLDRAQQAEEASCYRHFVVTPCLNEVRGRFRPQLIALGQRETAVRAGVRQRVEEERLVRVEEQRRQSEADRLRTEQRAATAVPVQQRQAELDQRNAERTAAQPAQIERARADRVNVQQAHEKAVADQAARAARAPANRARFDARQREVEEKRIAQERRAAQRDTKTPAAPLPGTPQPSSAPVPLR